MSSVWKRFSTSITWVASALPGSQAELSFFSTPVSFPASGTAPARTATHSASTIHLDHRPHTRRAMLPVVAISWFPPVRRDVVVARRGERMAGLLRFPSRYWTTRGVIRDTPYDARHIPDPRCGVPEP